MPRFEKHAFVSLEAPDEETAEKLFAALPMEIVDRGGVRVADLSLDDGPAYEEEIEDASDDG
jgi:hypothetical protein